MSSTWWTDNDLGHALEDRDYSRMEYLISKGHSFNGCKFGWYAVSCSGYSYNAFEYAVTQHDLQLICFVVDHGGEMKALDQPKPMFLSIFSRETGPDIFEYLCTTAYKKILNNETPVYLEMIGGILTYFDLKPEGFLKKELFNAAACNDTITAGRILEMLVGEKQGDQIFTVHCSPSTVHSLSLPLTVNCLPAEASAKAGQLSAVRIFGGKHELD